VAWATGWARRRAGRRGRLVEGPRDRRVELDLGVDGEDDRGDDARGQAPGDEREQDGGDAGQCPADHRQEVHQGPPHRPHSNGNSTPRIDALPGWQQAICREVRDLMHAADPEVTEAIKRTNRPYFVLQGHICALQAAKDHVNVFLYDGGIVPDPDGIITAGYGNKTARTVAIGQDETINAPALTAMFRQFIADNRAGGWRKLERAS